MANPATALPHDTTAPAAAVAATPVVDVLAVAYGSGNGTGVSDDHHDNGVSNVHNLRALFHIHHMHALNHDGRLHNHLIAYTRPIERYVRS